MADLIFASNKRTNRNIAIIFLLVTIASVSGLLGALGINLNSYQITAGISILWLFELITLAWVTYGIYKYKIGS
jgi:hypothetical protein